MLRSQVVIRPNLLGISGNSRSPDHLTGEPRLRGNCFDTEGSGGHTRSQSVTDQRDMTLHTGHADGWMMIIRTASENSDTVQHLTTNQELGNTVTTEIENS
jgi:hypothetical protein